MNLKGFIFCSPQRNLRLQNPEQNKAKTQKVSLVAVGQATCAERVNQNLPQRLLEKGKLSVCVRACVCVYVRVSLRHPALVLWGDNIFYNKTTVNINSIGCNDWVLLPPTEMVTVISQMPFSYRQVSEQNN